MHANVCFPDVYSGRLGGPCVELPKGADASGRLLR